MKNPGYLILLTVFALFSVQTTFAVVENGLIGIWRLQCQNQGTLQVLFDLVIAIGLILVWMRNDARQKNRNFWPWAILTLLAGSFGPLLYLLWPRTFALNAHRS